MPEAWDIVFLTESQNNGQAPDSGNMACFLSLVEFSAGLLDQASFNQNRLPFTAPQSTSL